jgi:hypothetical protein
MDTKQIQAMAADIYRVQSKGLDFRSPDDREASEMPGLALHGENRGSIPLERANEINELRLECDWPRLRAQLLPDKRR